MSPVIRRMVLRRIAKVLDLAVVSLTFIGAVAVSSGYFTWPSVAEFLALRIKVSNILVFAGYLVACAAIFSACGFYLSHRFSRWTRQAGEIFLATALITFILSVLPRQMLFATKEFLLLFWLMNFCILSLTRFLGYNLLYFARSQGRNLRHVVIIGDAKGTITLASRLEKDTTLGYRVVRVINAEDS